MGLIQRWVAEWSDLVEFEILPVVGAPKPPRPWPNPSGPSPTRSDRRHGPRLSPIANGRALGLQRSYAFLRDRRSGSRRLADLVLQRRPLLSAGKRGSPAGRHDGQHLRSGDLARRRRQPLPLQGIGSGGRLARHPGGLFGVRLRLADQPAPEAAAGLSFRRLRGDLPLSQRPRRAGRTPPSLPGARPAGGTGAVAPLGRQRHLVRLQRLGRLQPLRRHHRPRRRPLCAGPQHPKALEPRLRHPARRGPAHSPDHPAGPRCPAALSAHGMGLCQRLQQEVRLGRLGQLRAALPALGRARRLSPRPRQPARPAPGSRPPGALPLPW